MHPVAGAGAGAGESHCVTSGIPVGSSSSPNAEIERFLKKYRYRYHPNIEASVTADESATLLFTLMRGEPCSGADIAGALNCSPRRAYTITEKLRRHGCIERARHGSWIITERGRLACALVMHRSTTAAVLDQAS